MTIFADPGFLDRCRQLGEAFHEQLHVLLPDPEAHPADLEHDLQVGQALFLATFYQAPQLGVDLYNQWAKTAGYAPLTYIGSMVSADGSRSYLVNAVTAILRISAECHIEDVHDLRTPTAAGGMVETY